MTVKDLIWTLLKKQKWSQSDLAVKLGYKGQCAVSNRLRNQDGMGMSVHRLVRWLSVMGYVLKAEDAVSGETFTLDGKDCRIRLTDADGCSDQTHTSVYQALDEMGVSHRAFIKRVQQTGVPVSPGYIDKHCRAWSRDYGRPDVWSAIDETMRDLMLDRLESE